jgi:hypothetical protein
VIALFIGLLCVGINSMTMAWFIGGVISQWYLRNYRPNWFIKYKYVLSAAMDGGTQVLVFILNFAVFGAGGKERQFLPYLRNNWHSGNYEFCMQNPATGAEE